MVSGWYDSFLPWQLEDFAALQNVGRPPQLMIGPWSHTQEGLTAAGSATGWGGCAAICWVIGG